MSVPRGCVSSSWGGPKCPLVPTTWWWVWRGMGSRTQMERTRWRMSAPWGRAVPQTLGTLAALDRDTCGGKKSINWNQNNIYSKMCWIDCVNPLEVHSKNETSSQKFRYLNNTSTFLELMSCDYSLMSCDISCDTTWIIYTAHKYISILLNSCHVTIV